jgi:hypothetical protein
MRLGARGRSKSTVPITIAVLKAKMAFEAQKTPVSGLIK